MISVLTVLSRSLNEIDASNRSSSSENNRVDQDVTSDNYCDSALLWNTLNALILNDNCNNSRGSIGLFFKEMLPSLLDYDKLSLSTLWNQENSTYIGEKTGNDSFQHANMMNEFSKLSAVSASSDGASLTGCTNICHDPLSIVQNLFDLCENEFVSLLLDCNSDIQVKRNIDVSDEVNVLLMTNFTLAIKSGRISMLLRSVALMYIYQRYIQFSPISISRSIDQEDLEHKDDYSTDSMIELIKEIEISKDSPSIENPTGIDHNILSPVVASSSLLSTKLSIYQQLIVRLHEIEHVNDSNNKFGLTLTFGKAEHGKLGHGDSLQHRVIPTVVEALENCKIVKIDSMSTYTLALDESGSVFVWGTGSASSIPGSKRDISPKLFSSLCLQRSKVTDISCGLGHSLFLLDTGLVYSSGNGANGRLGLGDTNDRSDVSWIHYLAEENIVSVVCGASHSLVLTKKGCVYSFGKNTSGQLGLSIAEDVLKPRMIRSLPFNYSTIIQIAAGWEHTVALTNDGKLFSWGCGYKDNRRTSVPPVLGLGHNEGRNSPTFISSLDGIFIIQIACGWDHCLALDKDGKIMSWGSGQHGRLGHNNDDSFSVPCYVSSLDTTKVTCIAAGCEHSAAISDDGVLYTWGNGDVGRLGHGDNHHYLVPTPVSSIMKMNLNAAFVHCGDKFTAILCKPRNITSEFSYDNKVVRTVFTDTFLRDASSILQIQEYLYRSSISDLMSDFQPAECCRHHDTDILTKYLNVEYLKSIVKDELVQTTEAVHLNLNEYSINLYIQVSLKLSSITPSNNQQLSQELLSVLGIPHSTSFDIMKFCLAVDIPYAVECSPVTLAVLDYLLKIFHDQWLELILNIRENDLSSDTSQDILKHNFDNTLNTLLYLYDVLRSLLILLDVNADAVLLFNDYYCRHKNSVTVESNDFVQEDSITRRKSLTEDNSSYLTISPRYQSDSIEIIDLNTMSNADSVINLNVDLDDGNERESNQFVSDIEESITHEHSDVTEDKASTVVDDYNSVISGQLVDQVNDFRSSPAPSNDSLYDNDSSHQIVDNDIIESLSSNAGIMSATVISNEDGEIFDCNDNAVILNNESQFQSSDDQCYLQDDDGNKAKDECYDQILNDYSEYRDNLDNFKDSLFSILCTIESLSKHLLMFIFPGINRDQSLKLFTLNFRSDSVEQMEHATALSHVLHLTSFKLYSYIQNVVYHTGDLFFSSQDRVISIISILKSPYTSNDFYYFLPGLMLQDANNSKISVRENLIKIYQLSVYDGVIEFDKSEFEEQALTNNSFDGNNILTFVKFISENYIHQSELNIGYHFTHFNYIRISLLKLLKISLSLPFICLIDHFTRKLETPPLFTSPNLENQLATASDIVSVIYNGIIEDLNAIASKFQSTDFCNKETTDDSVRSYLDDSFTSYGISVYEFILKLLDSKVACKNDQVLSHPSIFSQAVKLCEIFHFYHKNLQTNSVNLGICVIFQKWLNKSFVNVFRYVGSTILKVVTIQHKACYRDYFCCNQVNEAKDKSQVPINNLDKESTIELVEKVVGYLRCSREAINEFSFGLQLKHMMTANSLSSFDKLLLIFPRIYDRSIINAVSRVSYLNSMVDIMNISFDLSDIDDLRDVLKCYLKFIQFTVYYQPDTRLIIYDKSSNNMLDTCISLLDNEVIRPNDEGKFIKVLNLIQDLGEVLTLTSNKLEPTESSSLRIKKLIQLLTSLQVKLDNLLRIYLSYIEMIVKYSGYQLLPKYISIFDSSPIINSNISSSAIGYTIGFWIKLPIISDVLDYINRISLNETIKSSSVDGESSDQTRFIHLFSRIPETGDVNYLSLFDHNFPCQLDPSVFLRVDEANKSMHLSVYITIANTEVVKSSHRVNLISTALSGNEWIHCTISLNHERCQIEKTGDTFIDTYLSFDKKKQPQYNYESTSSSMISSSSIASPSFKDNLKISLSLNSKIDQTLEVKSSVHRPSLHQNIVFGIVPIKLSKVIDKSAIFDDKYTNKIIISDVYWLPTVYDSVTLLNCETCGNLSEDINCPPSFLIKTIQRIQIIQQILMLSLMKSLQVTVENEECTNNLLQLLCRIMVTGSDIMHCIVFDVFQLTMRHLIVPSSKSITIEQYVAELKQSIVYISLMTSSIFSNETFFFPNENTMLKDIMLSSSELWNKRRYLSQIISYTYKQFHAGFTVLLPVNENIFLKGIASILCEGITLKLVKYSFIQDLLEKYPNLIVLYNLIPDICRRGWCQHLTLFDKVMVPSKGLHLFNQQNLRNGNDRRSDSSFNITLNSAFTTSASIINTTQLVTTGQVWLSNCQGFFEPHQTDTAHNMSSTLCSSSVIIPDIFIDRVLVTAGIFTKVKCKTKYLGFDDFEKPSNLPKRFNPIIDSYKLCSLQRRLLSPKKFLNGKLRLECTVNDQSKTSEILLSQTRPNNISESKTVDTFHQDALLMLELMTRLRSLANYFERATDCQSLLTLISSDIRNIISIASLSTDDLVTSIFERCNLKSSQLEVLKSLLKENDIVFLEQISLKQFKFLNFFQSNLPANYQQSMDFIQVIAGEISIVDSKIRGSLHFPTFRFKDVSLQRMTGRWYYEVSLLTDGLMQIGYANSSFHCDPIHGQGVGDDRNSWSYDGFRSKKWNISCESYGKKWKVGDVVGVLMDMDLLELRFSLNGQDLGPAFTNFTGTSGINGSSVKFDSIYPAISLNVRQIIRVNIGYDRFLFPPDEIDGKPYRGIREALANLQSPHVNLLKTKSVSVIDTIKDADEKQSVSISADLIESKSVDENKIDGTELDNLVSRNSSRLLFGRDSDDDSDVVDDSEDDSDDDGDDDEDEDDDDDCDDYGDGDDFKENDDGELRYNTYQLALRRANSTNDDQLQLKDDSIVLSTSTTSVHVQNYGIGEDIITTMAQNSDNSVSLDEIKREALIENLISMGFPYDWAIRATDVAGTSESSAITWIIERMESEQSKVNEGNDNDNDDDSSTRDGDGDGGNDDNEEFDEGMELPLEYLIHRNLESTGNYINETSVTVTNETSSNSHISSGINTQSRRAVSNESRGNLVSTTTSMARNLRVNGTIVNSPNANLDENGGRFRSSWNSDHENETMLFYDDLWNSRYAHRYQAISHQNNINSVSQSKKNRLHEDDGINIADALLGASAQGTDNNTLLSLPEGDAINLYPIFGSIIPLQYKLMNSNLYFSTDIQTSEVNTCGTTFAVVSKTPYEKEKQDVLNQISDLEYADLLPIVYCSQVALCIYYSKVILNKLTQSTCTTSSDLRSISLFESDLNKPFNSETSEPSNEHQSESSWLQNRLKNISLFGADHDLLQYDIFKHLTIQNKIYSSPLNSDNAFALCNIFILLFQQFMPAARGDHNYDLFPISSRTSISYYNSSAVTPLWDIPLLIPFMTASRIFVIRFCQSFQLLINNQHGVNCTGVTGSNSIKTIDHLMYLTVQIFHNSVLLHILKVESSSSFSSIYRPSIDSDLRDCKSNASVGHNESFADNIHGSSSLSALEESKLKSNVVEIDSKPFLEGSTSQIGDKNAAREKIDNCSLLEFYEFCNTLSLTIIDECLYAITQAKLLDSINSDINAMCVSKSNDYKKNWLSLSQISVIAGSSLSYEAMSSSGISGAPSLLKSAISKKPSNKNNRELRDDTRTTRSSHSRESSESAISGPRNRKRSIKPSSRNLDDSSHQLHRQLLCVIWAYTTLKTFLSLSILKNCQFSTSTTFHSSKSVFASAVIHLLSYKTFITLYDVFRQSSNPSLQFVCLDLCTDILSVLNSQLHQYLENENSSDISELSSPPYLMSLNMQISNVLVDTIPTIYSGFDLRYKTESMNMGLMGGSPTAGKNSFMFLYTQLTQVFSKFIVQANLLLDLMDYFTSITSFNKISLGQQDIDLQSYNRTNEVKDSIKSISDVGDCDCVHDFIIQDWSKNGQINKMGSDSESVITLAEFTVFVSQITSHSISIVWKQLQDVQVCGSKGVLKVTSCDNFGVSTRYNKTFALSSSPITCILKNHENRSPTLVSEDIDLNLGRFRIDNLLPDTLYKIELCLPTTLKYSGSPATTSEKSLNYSVLASTDSEPVFVFNTNFMSSTLSTLNHHRSLKNTSNKKWSSARINYPMESGVHSWDVKVDRCVSKNIFIGVCDGFAKFDNYCGCDKHGWAFLANKAIWFNKTKVKTYGELFKSGDIITVTLDLDLGVLSFSINSFDLGQAVVFNLNHSNAAAEPISMVKGALYPAFSLYNEDDQISILSHTVKYKQLSTSLNTLNNADHKKILSWKLSTVERLINRIEIAVQLLNLILRSQTTLSTDSSAFEKVLRLSSTNLMLTEIRCRWNLWTNFYRSSMSQQSLDNPLHLLTDETAGKSVKSYKTIDGDIIYILDDVKTCQEMSEGKLLPGDYVSMSDSVSSFIQGHGRVLGICRHKLWIDYVESNSNIHSMIYSGNPSNDLLSCMKENSLSNIIGYTQDTILHLISKGSLRVLYRQNMNQLSLMLSKAAYLWYYPIIGDDNSLKYESKSKPLCEFSSNEILLTSILQLKRKVQVTQTQWELKDDEALVTFIDGLARFHDIHPVQLPINAILASRTEFVQINPDGTSTTALNNASTEEDKNISLTNSTVQRLNRIFCFYSDEEICLRSLLLIHFNDIISPSLTLFLPLSTYNNQFSEFNRSYKNTDKQEPLRSFDSDITSLLLSAKGLIFKTVKDEYSQKLFASSVSNNYLTSLTASLVSNSSVSNSGNSNNANIPSSIADGENVYSHLMDLLQPPISPVEANSVETFCDDNRDSDVIGHSTKSNYSNPKSEIVSDDKSGDNSEINYKSTEHEKLHKIGKKTVKAKSLSSSLWLLEIVDELTYWNKIVNVNDENSSFSLAEDRAKAIKNLKSLTLGEYTTSVPVNICWKLVNRIQVSLVGQFYRHLQKIHYYWNNNLNNPCISPDAYDFSSMNNNINSLSVAKFVAKEGWEDVVRILLGSTLSLKYDKLPVQDRTAPFYVRPFSREHCNGETTAANISNSTLTLFKLFKLLNETVTDSDSSDAVPSLVVSDWSLYSAFLFDALFEAANFVSEVEQNGNLWLETEENSHQVNSIGVIDLLSQHMHITGVILGLAFLSDVAIDMTNLPHKVVDILSNRIEGNLSIGTYALKNLVKKDETLLLQFCGWCMFEGIVSIYPEYVLMLWSPNDWISRLEYSWTRASGYLSVNKLQQLALYHGDLNSYDQHIENFWIILREISPLQLSSFASKLTLSRQQFVSINQSSSKLASTNLVELGLTVPMINFVSPPQTEFLATESSNNDSSLADKIHIVYDVNIIYLSIPRLNNYEAMYVQLFSFLATM